MFQLAHNYASLRIFKTLSPPVAFDAGDPQSFVAFEGPPREPIDPFSGETRPNAIYISQALAFAVDSGVVEYSFDGTTVHGLIRATDGLVDFRGIREKGVYFRNSGGAASVRFWAW